MTSAGQEDEGESVNSAHQLHHLLQSHSIRMTDGSNGTTTLCRSALMCLRETKYKKVVQPNDTRKTCTTQPITSGALTRADRNRLKKLETLKKFPTLLFLPRLFALGVAAISLGLVCYCYDCCLCVFMPSVLSQSQTPRFHIHLRHSKLQMVSTNKGVN